MADQLAVLADFEARHGVVDDGQATVVEALLDDASALILSEVDGSVALWVTSAAEPAPRAVVSVCVEVVYRAWRNPDALAENRVDDVSVTYRPAGGTDALYLTDRELRVVRRASKRSSFVAVTLESPYSCSEIVDPLA